MDRYAIRLVDETAEIDVTLWEVVGHHARRFREGHYVLISGLSTSKVYKNAKGEVTWYVNGSTSCDTKIVNGKWFSENLKCSVCFYSYAIEMNSVHHKMFAGFILFSQHHCTEYEQKPPTMSSVRGYNRLVYRRRIR
jgi:hypothetical protein